MPMDVALATVMAGMLYVLVPGPATLAALGLSASQGRLACAKFLAAHLVGDLTWSALALLGIAGVSRLGPALFDALGVTCGLYLAWLGMKALRASGKRVVAVVDHPVRTGLIFGLTNPKAYPFAVAMFTAVLGRFGESAFTAEHAPVLMLSACIGFILADLIVVAWTGWRQIGRLYLAYERPVVRAIGLLFVLFGAKLTYDGVASFRARA